MAFLDLQVRWATIVFQSSITITGTKTDQKTLKIYATNYVTFYKMVAFLIDRKLWSDKTHTKK